MLELILNQNKNMIDTVPLRITKNDACQLLSISRDKLDKLIRDDSAFPRPIKEGVTRQAAVYFDRQSIVDWWNAQVAAAKKENQEQALVC